jgi:hypothetical protein
MQLAKLIYESLGNNVRNTVLEPGVYKQMPIDFMYKWKTSKIPRPDYSGFDKMIRARQAVPDEQVRCITAFGGLGVQGLDKQELLTIELEPLQTEIKEKEEKIQAKSVCKQCVALP